MRHDQLRFQAQLLDSLQESVVATDLDGRIAYWSKGAEHLYGYRDAEIMGQSITSIVEADDVGEEEARMRQVMKTGRWRGEYFRRRKDGSTFWADTVISLIRDEDGSPVGFVGIDRDVTAQKEAQAVLQSHAERNKLMADVSAALVVARMDYRDVLESISRRIAEYFGDVCVITLLSEDREELRPVAIHHPEPAAGTLWAELLRDTVYPVDDSPPGRAVQTLKPVRYSTLSAAEAHMIMPPAYRAWPRKVGVESLLVAPLATEASAIGTLGLARERSGEPYTDADEMFLQLLANRAALAIENARLRADERRAHHMAEALRSADAALTRTLELDAVLENVLDVLAKLIPYDSAAIVLREGHQQFILRTLRGYGDRADLARQIVVDLDDFPHFKAIVEDQTSVLVSDTHTDQAWVHDMPGTDHIRCWLGVPLIAGGEVIGLYGIEKSKPDSIRPEHVRAAEALAGQAAVAIQNAQLFDQVRAGRERLQALSRRLVEVQEEERRHIARELHDEVGQALTTLNLSLGLGAQSFEERAAEFQALIQDLTHRIRDISLELRPAMLDDLGLLPALLWQVERFSQQTGVAVDLEHRGLTDRRFPSDVETAAYRIVQAALTNVARHAEVDSARVRAWLADDTLYVQVEDEGRGFDPDAELEGWHTSGVSGMNERASLVGGQLIVESEPGQGTRLIAQLPLASRLERRSDGRSPERAEGLVEGRG